MPCAKSMRRPARKMSTAAAPAGSSVRRRRSSGSSISSRAMPSTSKASAAPTIETLYERDLLKEPADIFRLAKQPEKLGRVLAEKRAEQSAERRAKEGKDAVKKSKKDEEGESKLVENLVASIDRAPRNRARPFHQCARHPPCRRDRRRKLIARNYLTMRCIPRRDGKQACGGGTRRHRRRRRGGGARRSRISSTSRTTARVVRHLLEGSRREAGGGAEEIAARRSPARRSSSPARWKR